MACLSDWLAPLRLGDDTTVRHVCTLPAGHAGPCHCSCGQDRGAPAWLRRLDDDRWAISDRD